VTHAPTTARLRVLHHREEVMGTVVTLDLYVDEGDHVDRLAAHVGRARAALHRADAVFSTWMPDSPMSRLRRGEVALDQVPTEVVDVLAACRGARAATHGWFDPWALPGGVDPTGYVKGWAAERALDALRVPGVAAAVVNAAGDIASFGGPSPTTKFRFAVVDPVDRTRPAFVVEHTGAVATSGTYERGQHLFDPRTRRATASVASATVTGPELGLADALATALAVGGDPVLGCVAGIDGFEALVIGHDGSIRSTPGFPLARAVQGAVAVTCNGNDAELSPTPIR
jgi:thiamine biosynthesis lipoprotein